jgi:endonuclease/exonuclease/phosphatase family metal-dependent hydrolase
MAEVFASRENPMIVPGDFNSEWLAEKSVIKKLAEKAGMSVYDPGSTDLHTYNSSYRYDRILISDDPDLVHYEVLQDIISDHIAVLAEIQLKDTKD